MQAVWDFTVEDWSNYVCAGLINANSGKTCCAAVEVARAVTGNDPYNKYPKEGGRWFCVGKDLAHIGQVMWRKLGRAGAFKIIRDYNTDNWRSYRPWDPSDAARASSARSAPPLIPPRMIKEIAWENKKEGIPNVVRMHNGWEISFFSSLGKPPQGSDINGWWFDEEIVDGDWFPEMSARVLDHEGYGVWSATPQAGTDQLYELHKRSEQERETMGQPLVEEFLVLLNDNPHISEKAKREFAANLSEEDYRVRVGGEFAITSARVYPEFHKTKHVVPYFPIPPEWTRYAVVDPGHQICAVLFAAVPPDEKHVYLFDELYIRECNANLFGEHMARKTAHQTFQAFIIDAHMAIATQVGVGRTVEQQYQQALLENKVKSVSTGHGFIYGSDDITAGVLAVHDLLRLREDGTPKLQLLEGMCPNFIHEVERYNRKRDKFGVMDKPDQRRHSHCQDCCRYLALFRPRYVKPVKVKQSVGGAVKALRDKQKKRKGDDGNYIKLGPGVLSGR